jgi:acetyl esterase/lipase
VKTAFCSFLLLGLLAFAIQAEEPVASGSVSGPKFTSIQRLAPEHLQATREARLEFARERRPLPNLGVFQDFRAVIHVHAEDADHTKGTRAEALEAARKTGVQVVMLTDHGGPSSETWRGMRDGVLFIAGEENTGAGLLRFPRWGPDGKQLEEGELKFLSHIEERYEADSSGFHGMEIVNRHTDAKLDKGLQVYLGMAMINSGRWSALVENFEEYPDEFFGAGVDYRPEIMAKWDQETEGKKFTGIGANDAHQNQIFKGVTFDPYDVSFRNLTTHILARELTEEDIFEALREGRAYVSHDWLCDPTGFSFGAVSNLGVFTMGDAVPFLGRARLVAQTPVEARLKLFRHGTLMAETFGTNLTFQATQTGAYRVEAWLEVAGEERPWIYSNPIYLQFPSPDDLTLPSSELDERVEAKRDIPYAQGELADPSKQKLDLYLPRGKSGAPVFMFVHGGSWRSGDRSQYPSLGNLFAREGILTVAPSYRLAPAHPHPAQIEDVASAFAWVIRHIADFGGDPERVFIGGHSAGAHLAALLTLDEKYLQAHGLTRKNIRGTIALSGVYDLSSAESHSSVFGGNEQARREASPGFHIDSPAPPFLVTYCQWDYFSLPAQARQFHSDLTGAGIESELVYVPGRNHITTMLYLPRENDPTAAAMLQFLQQRF